MRISDWSSDVCSSDLITAAEGTLQLAQIEVDRRTTLVQREAVAQVQLDQAKAQYAQALGEVQRLQAALKRAQLDLSYTDTKAPIDGRIGRFPFSVGDYVTPSSARSEEPCVGKECVRTFRSRWPP